MEKFLIPAVPGAAPEKSPGPRATQEEEEEEEEGSAQQGSPKEMTPLPGVLWKKIRAEGLSCDYATLYGKAQADKIFQQLEKEVEYFEGEFTKLHIFGKWHDIPRKQVTYGDAGLTYTYSSVTFSPKPWIPVLNRLRDRIQLVTGHTFNFVLINRVVKFRRTGESTRSEEDAVSGEHEVQIEGVQTDLEAVELEDGSIVPKEFANPTDDTFMVEDVVEAIGFGKFQWKLSVLTGLAWMADAMEMMILSILAPQLHCEWRLPTWQVALLTSVVFLGMMFSSTLWGNISDQYGRKTGLKISVLWTLYYGVLSGFAPVYSWILVLRGLVGFGIGGVPQSVTLYAEFLPMKSRAKCILLIEVFWAIGTVFEVLLAVFVMPTLGWRWLLILSALPLMLFAVLCFWLPESARYDVLTGNQEKAIATLKRIATENGTPMPLGKLIMSRQEDRGKMRDLFTPQFRLTTLLLWFIWFSNAFSYYGLVLLTTELFQAGDLCSLSSRRKTVKAKCSLACEVLTEKDYIDLLWTTLSEFPGVLVTLWVIDRIGRKKTMALSFLVFAFCSLLLFLCVGRKVLTVLLFIARAFISGGFQAAYVYTPEVYPTATRALGLGTCSGVARVGALITPFIAQVMLESSVYLTLVVYSGCCILAALASCLLPIETRGRGLQESTHKEWGQEMFGRGVPQSNSGSQG